MKWMKRCRIYTADGLLVCDGRMKDCAAAIGVTINAFRNYAGGWNKMPGGMQIELSDWPIVFKPEKPANLCPCRYCVQNELERCAEDAAPCERFLKWFGENWRAAQEKLRRKQT